MRLGFGYALGVSSGFWAAAWAAGGPTQVGLLAVSCFAAGGLMLVSRGLPR